MVVVSLGTGCYQREVPVAKIPPPEVTVRQPVQRSLRQYAEYTGRVEALESVEIRARVTGYLDEVKFVEGDKVAEGTELFVIDQRPFHAVQKAAMAEVERLDALLKKTKADLDRMTLLFEKGATTQSDLDAATAAWLESQALLDGAKAAVERADLDVDFTTIRSPVAGRVSRAIITKGNLIAADQAGGSPLTTVVSVDPMYVYFDVDEYTLLEVMRRAREEAPDTRPSRVRDRKISVEIGLGNETGFPHTGTIDFADNRVDPDTGTMRLRGQFQNDEEFLIAGMFVRVRLPIADPTAQVLIPEYAIGTDLNQKYVWVVDVDGDNKAEKRTVTLGMRTEDGLRAAETGLAAEEWVIVNGMQRVRDQGVVDPKKEATAGSKTPDDEST